MMTLIGILLVTPPSVLALVVAFECLVAVIAPAPRPPPPPSRRPRVRVLVPAHDEAGTIGPTVRALLPELGPEDRVVVIADNCSDTTAAEAREAGADVLERHDTSRRGKGYALTFGVDALRSAPPEVVVIVDADCRVAPGALRMIAEQAVVTGCPVQARYILKPPEATPKQNVVGFAVVVKNHVRPLGLKILGFPAHLGGSGMAFTWDVLANAPATEGWIVEDLLLGLELARKGTPPVYLPEAHVTSALPTGDQATKKQRTRWEHGWLATIQREAPRLFADALRTGRADLFALALDLAVPPLAMLVLLQLATVAVAAVFALLGAPAPLQLASGAFGWLGLGIFVAWAAFGRDVVRLSDLLSIPAYVLGKVPVYASYLTGKKSTTWERTDRDAAGQRLLDAQQKGEPPREP
jgi:cellulose synthase/poly-beta-1,6-N-acetylglucosamine synthase-like glycosyltransferase